MTYSPKKPGVTRPGASKFGNPGQSPLAQNAAYTGQSSVPQAEEEVKQMLEILVRDLEQETDVAVNALKRRTQILIRFKFGLGRKLQEYGAEGRTIASTLDREIEKAEDSLEDLMRLKNDSVNKIRKILQAR